MRMSKVVALTALCAMTLALTLPGCKRSEEAGKAKPTRSENQSADNASAESRPSGRTGPADTGPADTTRPENPQDAKPANSEPSGNQSGESNTDAGDDPAGDDTADDDTADDKPTDARPTVAQEPILDNPTTAAGRGAPDLNSLTAHAAWIHVDGQTGEYIDEDGQPQIQWVIHGPVKRAPTFRVEVYEPLLGKPRDFLCALQTKESYDGTSVIYAIRAKEGTFETGKDYSLLEPGENFIVIDKKTGEEIEHLPLLSPGVYGIVGHVKNTEWGVEGMAVTYFTVGNE